MTSVSRQTLAAALGLLATLALAFPVYLTVVSPIQERRSQTVSYIRLRNALALATQAVQEPIAAGTPVALLQIPSLGLSQVVLEGTDGATLREGPGHLATSVLPGQAGTSVIFGRRASFGAPFGSIAGLSPGAAIRTTTGQGTAQYVVRTVRAPGRVTGVPGAGVDRLSLVTAAGPGFFPSGIITVDATLEPSSGTAFPATAPRSAVGPEDLALAADTGATVPLALWSEALLGVGAALAVSWVRLGRATTWLIGLPTVVAVGWHVAESAVLLLPNVL